MSGKGIMNAAAGLIAVIGMLIVIPVSDLSAADKTVRLGYIDHPGSALCLIAAAKGYYNDEELNVILSRFPDSNSGLSALERGVIDAGAFEVSNTMRAIAEKKGFRIIAGGGIHNASGPQDQRDEAGQRDMDPSGVVVVIPAQWPVAEKGTIIRLTAALIRAYRSQHESLGFNTTKPAEDKNASLVFDPHPDYYRLERLWKRLELQTPSMKRSFLADHVYEEIYCDALDRLLLGPIDTVLQTLYSKAICIPNCCPANQNTLQ